MKPGWKLVGGVGLGAALMYLLDPDRGKRRRGLLRDRVFHGIRSAGDTMGVFSRSAANRGRGLFAKAKSPFEPQPVTDTVLTERVRSQIGHVLSHAGAIDVSVRNGRVTLSGPVRLGEVRTLLRRVSRVPGVTGVDNELEASDAKVPAGREGSEGHPQTPTQ